MDEIHSNVAFKFNLRRYTVGKMVTDHAAVVEQMSTDHLAEVEEFSEVIGLLKSDNSAGPCTSISKQSG
jgi:hypothetical protein